MLLGFDPEATLPAATSRPSLSIATAAIPAMAFVPKLVTTLPPVPNVLSSAPVGVYRASAKTPGVGKKAVEFS